MLLINNDQSLSILKKGYTFSSKEAEEEWDWSIRLLKKLSGARVLQGAHLEAQIKVSTYQSDGPADVWTAFEWGWSIGSDWAQRHHVEEGAEAAGVIDGVSSITYYAGVKDCISHSPTIVLGFMKRDRVDRETVERAALATLSPPDRE